MCLFRHFFARLDISWTIFSAKDICVSGTTTWNTQCRLKRCRCGYFLGRIRYIVPTLQAEQICAVIVEWSSYVGNLKFTFSTVSGCFSKEFSEFGDIPQFLDSAIYCHPEQQRGMGCFSERALAHLPGYLNGLTVGIHGEQGGGGGEINTRLDAHWPVQRAPLPQDVIQES